MNAAAGHRALIPHLRVPISLSAVLIAWAVASAAAGVGDPQIRTDHPWYPGELACSTFARLQATQAAIYERVVGRPPVSDQDKVLAAWLWRNTHYAHGEEGAEDLWGEGFTQGHDLRTREYWTGLFAHGFGLCGTTHSQWTAELEALLGHNRCRGVGMAGHNAFEVFLQGNDPGAPGRWALLDHDLSTVVFESSGEHLLSAAEVHADWRRLTDRAAGQDRQQGWLVCGLHPGDGASYQRYDVAEYLAGYSGPPPLVHLRRGETLRRYHQPGLADGRTFVFWGRNAATGDIPGPERSLTWVNQPEHMHGSTTGAGHHPGQARYGNAVYVYRPNFADGTYREAVVAEDAHSLTWEFYTPYVIGATPATQEPWAIYEKGGKNGLVVESDAACQVSISTDQGTSWQLAGALPGVLDLTDLAKGRRQYFLRTDVPAAELRDTHWTITTVCQANAAIMPRLTDGGCRVDFASSGRAVASAGPNLPQAQAHLVGGAFGSPRVTLALRTPRGESAVEVHAAAHVASSNPPSADVRYAIEVSVDGGGSWQPLVSDWRITRYDEEPADFWSQSFCWGSLLLDDSVSPANGAPPGVLVRFSNDGGKNYLRAEAHLVYRTASHDATRVTFAWTDQGGSKQAEHVFAPSPVDGSALPLAAGAQSSSWHVPTGAGVQTQWVEFSPVASE